MTYPAIAIDRLEPLQIGRQLTTEIALKDPLVIRDDVQNLVKILFRQILRTQIGVDTRFFDDLISPQRTDAVDVTERITDLLFGRDFYAKETRHI